MTDTTHDPFGAQQDPVPPQPALPRAAPDYTTLSPYKIALIGGLALVTVLPNMLISNLIEEREQRQESVRQEFARNWGPEQNLYAPTLVIPYQVNERPRQYIKIASTRL